MSVLDFHRVSKRFGQQIALAAVDLTVHHGEIHGIIGPNGAGKSTLVGIAMGLIAPDEGRVAIMGNTVGGRWRSGWPPIGFMSPFIELPAPFTVRQFLHLHAAYQALAEPRKRIAAVVAWFDLSDLMDRRIAALSTGQRTRVAMARALLNEPTILVLDEPTASLDPLTALMLRRHLAQMNADLGVTTILTSHHLADIEELCTHVAVLRGGRIVAAGPVDEVPARMGCKSLHDVMIGASNHAT
jgi:ABC-2 type transport system ATP-binding protein